MDKNCYGCDEKITCGILFDDKYYCKECYYGLI